MKTTYRLVFHGPNDDKDCRRVAIRFAKKFYGKFSYTSFWSKRDGWVGPEGKAAYSVVIPKHWGVDALREVKNNNRELMPGLRYSHHY